VAVAFPVDGCRELEGSGLAGTMVLIQRGTCEFGTKALHAQNAGALGVIVYNNVAGDAIGMAAGSDGGIQERERARARASQ
jgi:hypothetical protein